METYKPYSFDVLNPEVGVYAKGYPYVTAFGKTESEARGLALEYLDAGELVGNLR